MSEPRRSVLLLSGGIDSALCGRMLSGRGSVLACLFVDYGQRAASAERKAAERVSGHLGAELTVRRIAGGPSRGEGEHPGRNSMLVAAAAFEAGRGPAEVVLGIHAGTGYYDCSPRFANVMNTPLLEQSDGRVGLSVPLLEWTKRDVLEAFASSDLPLDDTHSCEAGPVPCGRCRSCLDRAAACASRRDGASRASR